VASRVDSGRVVQFSARKPSKCGGKRRGAGRKAAPAESYEAARRRKESALADIRQLEANKRKGELVEVDAVAREFASLCGTIRGALLAVPNRLRERLPHLTPEDVLVIDEEIRAALTRLADGDDHWAGSGTVRLRPDGLLRE
jgi:phage terminase Nu1 subunit (DNA packaging protein)